MNEPTHLDLFSGIGGFALAAQWAGFRTIGFCEIDKYCQKVLAKNFLADASINGLDRGEIKRGNRKVDDGAAQGQNEAKCPEGRSCLRAAIHSDIFDFSGGEYRGVDLITGGFPCQPFSFAGKRRGAADDRAIWPQMFRVIKEARPAWVLGENVPGLIAMELDNVLSDLEGIGYATRAFVIPACAVDARHRRDRLWIVGRLCYAPEQRFPNGSSLPMGRTRKLQQEPERPDSNGWCRWLPEPGVCGMVDELSKGLDSIMISHDIMGYATSTDARSSKALRVLRESNSQETIQRNIGGHGKISSEEILRSGVHGESFPDEISIEQLFEAIPKDELRELWERVAATGSSSGLRQIKQLNRKSANSLREVPLGMALEARQIASYFLLRLRKACGDLGFVCNSPDAVKKVWLALSEEYRDWGFRATWMGSFHAEWPNVPRVAAGVKNRVDRLKGLGNAIVPAVAYEILRVIYAEIMHERIS